MDVVDTTRLTDWPHVRAVSLHDVDTMVRLIDSGRDRDPAPVRTPETPFETTVMGNCPRVRSVLSEYTKSLLAFSAQGQGDARLPAQAGYYKLDT